MHWFLVIYLFSTDELLITEYNTQKECVAVEKKVRKVLMKNNKDVKDITCEEGEILESYTPEEKVESL